MLGSTSSAQSGVVVRQPMSVVLFDDRPDELIGLRLAVLSLQATAPGLDISAVVPRASSEFLAWADRYQLRVLEPPPHLTATGWDVKPTILLYLLDAGASQVLWFDTDIIATGDIRPLLDRHDTETLVATEEYHWGYHQGTAVRTERLGLEVGRIFSRSVNSGLVRVSSHHHRLLTAWVDVLSTTAYKEAQGLPVSHRPMAYLGDQQVLEGLLGSRDFADIPVAQLRRGVEIAQCFGPSGFTASERWRARHQLPPLIHAMGRKPWSRPPSGNGSIGRRAANLWEDAHLDLTPYVGAAASYVDQLGVPSDWIKPRTVVGRTLSLVDSVALRELPLTVVDSAQRAVRRRLKIRQIPV